MKVTCRFKGIQINTDTYKRRLDVLLSKHIEKAAATWLNATVLLLIPVWSGASRATFLKLARAVNFPLTITGIRANPDLIGNQPDRWGPRAGFQRSQGSVTKDPSIGLFTFTYGTDLFHLVFNEHNNANSSPAAGKLFSRLLEPGPYNFQEIGADAFRDYGQTQVVMPSPWGALKTTQIRVGK